MGSGTTLMRLILDSHPNLAIAHETGFARAMVANEWIPFWNVGGEWFGRIGWEQDELEAAMRDFYGSLFGRFAERRGAGRWGDKTPFHTWHIPLLSRVFPDAVFVGTTRHPAAVATSVHERFRYPWPASVRHWVRSNTEMCHQGAALGDRFALCRYEELVTRPEVVMRELLGWLGEPWDELVLTFHDVHSRRGTAAEVEGSTRSDEPIDATRAARWTTAVDVEARRLLHRTTVPLATMLGYDVTAPVPPRPLVGDGSGRTLATGRDLARLVARSTGIDWDERPQPTMENRELRKSDLKALKRQAAATARSPSAVLLLEARRRLRPLRRRR
jgi:hypothetical protein